MQFFINTFSKLIWALFLVAISISASAQKKSGEIGISLGGSYYIGDINKIPFYGTHISAGAFYRHTFDTRYAVKGNFTYGTLSGDDANSSSDFQLQRNRSFTGVFYELGGVAEFNFIPFLPAKKKYTYTPYVFAGLAVAYYPKGTTTMIFNIPFGIGVKYNLNSNFVLGAFAGMHKTFSDRIDFDYIPPTPHRPDKQSGYAGNKDWYSVFGVSLSYKIKYRIKCPAFD